MTKKKLKKLLSHTNIVGCINTVADAQYALRWPGAADIYELRLDRFFPRREENEDEGRIAAERNVVISIVKALRKKKKLIILTIRYHAEGGWAQLTDGERAVLFAEYIRLADFIDIEVASLPLLEDAIISMRKEHSFGLIASLHDFKRVPDVGRVQLALAEADRFAACAFKVAVQAATKEEFAQFVEMLGGLVVPQSIELVPMTMGDSGKMFRLFAAWLGVPLIYGYLKAPSASGQWQVFEFRKAFQQIGGSVK